MVVQAGWPGATLDDTLQQVTERIERKLQETPNLDLPEQLHDARRHDRSSSTCKGYDAAPRGARHLVPGAQEDRRHPPHAAAGRRRARSSTTSSATPIGIIYGFTADGFTHRELRDYVEDVRTRAAARAGRLQDRAPRRPGRADLRRVLDRAARRSRPRPPRADRGAAGAERRQPGRDRCRPATRRSALRVSGAFRSEQDILDVNFVAERPHLPAERHRRRCSRGYADPPQPMFRVNGKPAIGLAISMRDGGDVLALGQQRRARDGRDHRRTCRSASSRILVADQPEVVEHAVGEFMKSLWQAIAIVLAVSFVSLGLRPGAVVALVDPAGARHRLRGHGVDRHRPAAHLARRADHRARPAGRRRDDHRRHDDRRGSRRATTRMTAATFAYTSTAFPMLTGTLVTHRRLRADRLRARARPANTPSRSSRSSRIALIVSWFVAVLFAPLLGVWLLQDAEAAHAEPSRGS